MKIYLMGICGTAMSHMALLLKALGHQVVGSDAHFFNPIADLLVKNEIETFVGFDVERFKNIHPDAVIVGNVIARGHPEIEYLLNTHCCPFYSFPQYLEQYVLPHRSTFVVTGTHGKTTTTTLLAYLLKQTCDPGYLIGGIPRNFPSGASLGHGLDPFVIEGDEYDTAFFDKRSKFFHYWPNTLIINNLEFDHGDIFSDLTSIQRTFSQLTRLVPSQGHILFNGDDNNVVALFPCDWTQTYSVGFGDHNMWQIKHFQTLEFGSCFDLWYQNECVYSSIHSPLRGTFNARNLAMAMAACHVNGYLSINTQCLKNFLGIQRRQTLLFKSQNLTVFEDFAHHPTAIKFVLEMLRECYPKHKLIACFEPACNTSASQFFADQAHWAFQQADEVWLGPRKTNLYCNRFINGLIPMDVAQVGQKLRQCGLKVQIYTSLESLCEGIANLIPETQTILCCFSNGRLSSLLSKTFLLKGSCF